MAGTVTPTDGSVTFANYWYYCISGNSCKADIGGEQRRRRLVDWADTRQCTASWNLQTLPNSHFTFLMVLLSETDWFGYVASDFNYIEWHIKVGFGTAGSTDPD